MSIDPFIGSFSRQPGWLASRPLGSLVRQYAESMQIQRYSDLTIRHYLSALAHFNFWAASTSLAVSDIGETTIGEFIDLHLPRCACPEPCFKGRLETGAALRRLLMLLRQ